MSSAAIVNFKPSFLLGGIDLARKAIAQFTNGLNSLSSELTGFIKKSGDQEKALNDITERNRGLAETMHARNFSPTTEFITNPISEKVNGKYITEDHIKIGQYLHEIYSVDKTNRIKKPTLFRELFHRLNLGDFNADKLKDQLASFTKLIEQQKTHFEQRDPNQNPLPGINLVKGVSAGSFDSQKTRVRRSILLEGPFFQTLKQKFKPNSTDPTDLNTLRDYKLAVVDFLLGSVARYYQASANRRGLTVTSNLQSPDNPLTTLVKSIDYFLKL